jgi:hypothetical protein
MDAQGNATAMWEHITFVDPEYNREIYSAYKPIGGTWGPPEVISNGVSNFVRPFQSQETLAVNLKGDVIAIWHVENSTLMSAFHEFNQPWQAPDVVFSSEDQAFYESIGLASCGFAVALWSNGGDDTVMAAINENLLNLAPTNLSLTRCRQNFATQSTFISILTWASSCECCILKFNIYCNGRLIGSVPATGPYRFENPKNCNTQCNYTITSVSIFGIESDPVSFHIQ